MVNLIVPPNLASHCWLQSCYSWAATKLQSIHRSTSSSSSSYPSVTECSLEESGSFVCDFETTILRSSSLFPYLMLVAFEGGSLLRSFLLLLSYPLVLILRNEEAGLKVMVFITFCGLKRRSAELVSRAVLPKFYLENVNLHSYEVMASTKRRVVVTMMPRVMVKIFLREYLGVGEIVATELEVTRGGRFFTGFVSSGASLVERRKALEDVFGEEKADVGLVSYCGTPHDNLLILSCCEEPYTVTRESSNGPSSALPRDKYPKPLIFHDGRLAFLPTPLSSLFLFLYLPLGIFVAVLRIAFVLVLPYKIVFTFGPITGFIFRGKNLPTNGGKASGGGVLYVCNHRTLYDPLMVFALLRTPLTALTYSLSPVCERLSPIRTVRLTRDRAADAAKIQELLKERDLVVCPEGTTCREPYLLRFSALFAELTDEVVPVAVDCKGSMFYGTTASGLKWLDPVIFLMNPWPEYEVRILGPVEKEFTCGGGGLKAVDVANGVQRRIGDELGFECTALTRRDKYLILAGNDGSVKKE